jgi:hypothetical protein
VLVEMTLPKGPDGGSDLEAGGDARGLQRERLRDEVRRLEQAGELTAALQAIRDARLDAADRDGFQPEIARLKQAARLHARYGQAVAAVQAGDAEAAAQMAAVVAVDPRYRDAARLLYETVSGANVGTLTSEVEASREAARRLEAERDRLARGRARLAWLAGAEAVVLGVVLGWLAWGRPPSPPADGRTRATAPHGDARHAPLAEDASPERRSQEQAPPVVESAPTAEAAGHASAPSASTPGAAAEGPPPAVDGPCHHVGERCSSTLECCVGAMCYGTTCQDAQRTTVFGPYRP